LRTAEAANEEIPKPLFRAFQIVRRVHRSQHIVARNLAIKRGGKPLKPGVANGRIDLLLFH
jgi:hypothetical protein